jgi:hypothetical protein
MFRVDGLLRQGVPMMVALAFILPAVGAVGVTGFERVSVTSNSPPELAPLVELMGVAGLSLQFSASASDPDGDTLTYTWDFGDGSPLAVGNPVEHVYALAGKYDYSVDVDDSGGHTVSGQATAWIAFPLTLGWKGWNLFSLPLVGWGYMASTLPLELGDVVAEYNQTTKRYRVYTFGISPPFSDFPIQPHRGYWLFTHSPKTLNLYGSVPTEQQSVSLTSPSPYGGWIIFGFLGLKSHKASQMPGMFTGWIGAVARYDPSTMRILTWVVGGPPFTDFYITPGMAVFIWITMSGVLSYTP